MHDALKQESIDDAVLGTYSPKRVNGMAESLGIISGMSLDLTQTDPDDRKPWDFNKKEKRDKSS